MSKTVRIQMRRGLSGPGSGVFGEDGTTWGEGEIHEASPAFARWLIDRGRARLAPPEAPVVSQTAPEPAPAAEGGDPASEVDPTPKAPPSRGGRRRKGK